MKRTTRVSLPARRVSAVAAGLQRAAGQAHAMAPGAAERSVTLRTRRFPRRSVPRTRTGTRARMVRVRKMRVPLLLARTRNDETGAVVLPGDRRPPVAPPPPPVPGDVVGVAVGEAPGDCVGLGDAVGLGVGTVPLSLTKKRPLMPAWRVQRKL